MFLHWNYYVCITHPRSDQFIYKAIHLVNNNKKCSWGWNVVGRSIGLEGMVVLRRLVHLDEEQ